MSKTITVNISFCFVVWLAKCEHKVWKTQLKTLKKDCLSSSECRSDLFISIPFSIVKTIYVSIISFVTNILPHSGIKVRLEAPLTSEI